MQSYDYRQRQGVEEVSWEQFAQLVTVWREDGVYEVEIVDYH